MWCGSESIGRSWWRAGPRRPCDLAPAGREASRLGGSRSRSSGVASQGKSRAAATQVGTWGGAVAEKRAKSSESDGILLMA